MKIKRKIHASNTIGTSELEQVAEPAIDEGCASQYSDAIQFIKSAIDELAQLPDDEKARDSIANLSVVLFDLSC